MESNTCRSCIRKSREDKEDMNQDAEHTSPDSELVDWLSDSTRASYKLNDSYVIIEKGNEKIVLTYAELVRFQKFARNITVAIVRGW